MPTLRERAASFLLGDERRKLEKITQVLYNAYLEGPFILPPDQLIAQLKEQGPDLLYDLVQQLQWETLGAAGYAQDLTAERTRAIDESRRLWKYSPIAQWLIWLMTNYGFGENIVVVPEDEDAVETWEEFWTADHNQPVLAADRIAELSNWTLVDGDRFLAYYASTMDGETTVRTVNTKEIVEIVTDPDDSSLPLFYKRQWTDARQRQQTWYYPDHHAFFDGTLDRAELPGGAVRADEQNSKTTVVVQHIAFNGKDPDSLYGWPFLGTGAPWIRAHKRHLENRLAVSASKAMYVRKATVKGGSRAVDSVIANLRSALSSTQSVETNPPAVAGSTLVENQAVTTTDFPMTTGASDAKVDELMFLRQAALSGGVYPHYMGAGDAYRLATATAMESPVQRQFSRYQVFWSAQFRKMVRVVLQMKEKYSDVTFQTYEAEVSTDKLVEVDLDGMSTALGRVFQAVINPQAQLGAIPADVMKGMLQATLRTVLQALGVDAETVIGDEVWPEVEEPEREEEEVEEGGKGSGWFAPPKGTHVGKGKRTWQGERIYTIESISNEIGTPSENYTRLGHCVKDTPSEASIGPPLVEGEIHKKDKVRFSKYLEEREEYGMDVAAGWAAEEFIWGYGHWGMVYDIPEEAAFKSFEPGEFVFDIGNEDIEIPAVLLNVTKAHDRGLSDIEIVKEIKEAKSEGFTVYVVQYDKDSNPLPMGKKQRESGLEESIALALQNYRQGLIDADDLVAFLVPSRLEEGGPGSGWFAPPKGTHTGKEEKKIERIDDPAAHSRTQKIEGLIQLGVNGRDDEDLISDVTDDVIQEMKDEYGEYTEDFEQIDYSYAEDATYRWSVDSHHKDAIWLHAAAEKEFGSNVSEFTEGRLKKDFRQMDITEDRRLLRTIYNRTQDELRSRGLTPEMEVVLYRGKAGKPPFLQSGQATGNALESWTTSRKWAEFYVKRNDEKGIGGFVITTKIPLSKIVALPHTGLGLGSVNEVVILGGKPLDVLVYEVKSD